MDIFSVARVFAALIVSLLILSCDDSPNLPEDQKKFVKTLGEFNERYRSANDVGRKNLRSERAKSLCAITMAPDVHNWVGTLSRVKQNYDGQVEIMVTLDSNITFQTRSLLTESINAHIRPESPLVPVIAKLKEKEVVVFSGRLYRDQPAHRDQTDCFRELSVTESGSMREPEFLFCFSSISPAATPKLTRPSQSDPTDSRSCVTQAVYSEAIEKVRSLRRPL